MAAGGHASTPLPAAGTGQGRTHPAAQRPVSRRPGTCLRRGRREVPALCRLPGVRPVLARGGIRGHRVGRVQQLAERGVGGQHHRDPGGGLQGPAAGWAQAPVPRQRRAVGVAVRAAPRDARPRPRRRGRCPGRARGRCRRWWRVPAGEPGRAARITVGSVHPPTISRGGAHPLALPQHLCTGRVGTAPGCGRRPPPPAATGSCPAAGTPRRPPRAPGARSARPGSGRSGPAPAR